MTPDTISRWLKRTLDDAGIESQYTGHSCRAASTSAANKLGVNIDIIMEKAGWTNASTFGRYYKKATADNDNFADKILENFTV